MLEDLARRAAIYLFPVYEMYRTRWNATVNEKNPARQKLNRLLHVPMLAGPRSRAVTTPNADTLYSSAWLDLSLEPVFLTVPDMGGRYYSFALMSLFTDNFAYVCRRLDGNRPPPRMIVGPAWKGEAERDVVLVRAPTNGVWLLGRVLVDGPPDLETVWTLQSRTLLETPDMRNERRILETQELMRQRTTRRPSRWPTGRRSTRPIRSTCSRSACGRWARARWPSATRRDLRSSRRCGCGPAASSTCAASARPSARRSSAASPRRATRSAPRRRTGTTINGWSYPEAPSRQLRRRLSLSRLIALTGLAALEPAEATYLMCDTDSEGRRLDGRARYVLRFEPDQRPPARAFWSLTMYEVTPEGRAFLVDNPISRYAIGDRSRGLVRGRDGTLEIALQHERPDGRDVNWLPAPAGPMRLVLRAYEPDEALLDGTWRMPRCRRRSSFPLRWARATPVALFFAFDT
jgi:hypothetical protein